MKPILLLLAIGCLDAAGFAAPAGDWASLPHTPAIQTGELIQVRTVDRKKVRGAFASIDESGLVLRTPGGAQRIARPSGRAISVKRRAHRVRNALIGFAAGGALAYVAGSLECRGRGEWACFGTLFNGVPVGMSVGTITGALLPAGWREVYRAQ